MPAAPRAVTILSEPRPVQMADEWFGLATLDHFWIKRRFDVCRKLLAKMPVRSFAIAEVGCGHGIVQRQFEDEWNVSVDGFDLNLRALEDQISRRSTLYYYDVLEKRPEFEACYDLILLFDVLEHIERDDDFLKSLLFHLKEDGLVLINVPADMWLYSRYDVAAGHARRYDISKLRRIAKHCELRMARWTYWGLPLYPLLMLRKFILRRTPRSEVIAAGFSPRNAITNLALHWAARAELIPQHKFGTSLMALLARQPS
jgi:SAM-dependent methyltransferase